MRKTLAEFQKYLPEGMTVGVNFDSTKFIEESVNEIQLELLLSVLLTALVCWMFLGSFSSTLNVILAIPMSLLGTVAIIYFLGFTFNTFTLLAMALAVGIVVDDAIMVMENIYRHAESGKDLVPRRPGGHATRSPSRRWPPPWRWWPSSSRSSSSPASSAASSCSSASPCAWPSSSPTSRRSPWRRPAARSSW